MLNDKTRNRGSDRTGSPNKFSKHSAEVLDSLNFNVIDALNDHYEDITKRIKVEECNVKVRKSYLLLLAQEQANTMKALLPYANIKPSKLIEQEQSETLPFAVKLSAGSPASEKGIPKVAV